MLLIGDIHANAKHTNAIIIQLKTFVAAHDAEKNVIFLGDYMYMFSYDRGALSQLFDLFLELWHSGKNVYILTGNHDWLAQWFIYQEGKKVSDILNRTAEQKLLFITEPEVHTIEQKEILFMPYNKKFLTTYKESLDIPTTHQGQSTQDNSSHNESFFEEKMSPKATILTNSLSLLQSQNTNEQLSGALNHYLLENYQEDMVLIHHYYTAQVRFPGQDAVFDYKDIALDPLRTQYANRVISGHIHKSFVYHHYLCVGSVWYTTSGERDHCKWVWQWNTRDDVFAGRELSINPYYAINDTDSRTFDKNYIIDTMQQVRNTHKSLFAPKPGEHNLTISRTQDAEYSLANTTLLLYTTKNVEQITDILPEELKNHVGDIQLKHRSADFKDMTELLDISQYNIQQSLLDRKELVKKYIMSRYGDESEKYRTLLSELNIL